MTNIKNLFICTILSLGFISVEAKVSLASMTNVDVNVNGRLIDPDTHHYRKALRYYNKGDKGTALQRFKFSAEFGGNKAIKFISLMYLDGDGVSQDLIKGQAWLKLSADRKDSDSMALWEKFKKGSNKDEMALVIQEYNQLKKDYGNITVMTNVLKFYRRYKGQTLGRPNTIHFQGKNVVLNEIQIMKLSTQIREFYMETKQNIGIITQGEIKEKED